MDNTCNDTNKNVPIKTSNAYRKKWVKEELFIWSIWVIPIFMFLLMTIGGTANNFALMFQKFDPETKTYVGYGFGNFIDVWNDILSNPLIGISIKNSVIIWLMNTFLLFPVELLVSFALYKKVYGEGVFRVILFLPRIISAMVWTLIFTYLLEFVFKTPDGVSLLFNPDTSFMTLYLYGFWLSFAGNMVIYTGAMSRIPYSIVEYAKLDGLGYLREFVTITIPLIFPTISVILITMISGLINSTLPLYQFFGESAREELYSLHYFTYVMVIGSKSNEIYYPYTAAMSMLLSLVILPGTMIIRHLCEKYGPSVEY